MFFFYKLEFSSILFGNIFISASRSLTQYVFSISFALFGCCGCLLYFPCFSPRLLFLFFIHLQVFIGFYCFLNEEKCSNTHRIISKKYFSSCAKSTEKHLDKRFPTMIRASDVCFFITCPEFPLRFAFWFFFSFRFVFIVFLVFLGISSENWWFWTFEQQHNI